MSENVQNIKDGKDFFIFRWENDRLEIFWKITDTAIKVTLRGDIANELQLFLIILLFNYLKPFWQNFLIHSILSLRYLSHNSSSFFISTIFLSNPE